MSDKRKAAKILRKIARKENTTLNQVKRSITEVITYGMASEEPRAKAFWSTIPHENEIPTPEEVICYFISLQPKQDEQFFYRTKGSIISVAKTPSSV